MHHRQLDKVLGILSYIACFIQEVEYKVEGMLDDI